MNIIFIAYSAAKGGQHTYMEYLRKHHGASINNALALGAAQGGYIVCAESLRKEGANINAIAQGAARGGYIEYAESLIKQGADINKVARGAARGGYIDYAESLKKRGANITEIAQGAAEGGYTDYAEWFRKEGADINAIAQSAAQGGYIAYAEWLRQKGADINFIAYGASIGSHRNYAEYLRKQGANIKVLAQGAAFVGHHKYLEFLIKQGACINIDIVRSILKGGHLSNKESISRFLMYFENQDIVKKLIKRINECQDVSYHIKQPPLIEKQLLYKKTTVKKRIESIFKFKNKYDLDISQASVMQQKGINFISFWLLQAMPQLLCGTQIKKNIQRPGLNHDVIMYITSFIFPILSQQQISDLQFKLNRFMLNNSIKRCLPHISKPKNGSSKGTSLNLERIKKFQEIIGAINHDAFSSLCQSQLTTFSKEASNNTSAQKVVEDQDNSDPYYKSLIRAKQRAF